MTAFDPAPKPASRAAALAAALMLSACASGPDLPKPGPIVSRHYDEGAERRLAAAPGPGAAPAIVLGASASRDWWRAFRSPKLDAVIARALAGNHDLAAADAALRRARDLVAVARGGLRPQLDLGADAGGARSAQGAAAAGTFYAVGPRVSFDPDLFGGLRSGVKAQDALADLEAHRTQAAYLTLTGDVAATALQLASARAQIEAVQALLIDDRRTVDLVRAGHAHGGATQADMAQAESQLAQDETLLPPLEQQRDAARHALSVLAGEGPADWTAPDFDLDDFDLPAALPVSLPSDLARGRPDIQAADDRLRAAAADVGVAAADLYPRLQLSASVVGAGPGALWSLAAGLAGPISHGGSLKANRRAAVDGYDAALASYRQTVVRALGQVADLLQAIDHDGAEHAAQAHALAAAQASLDLDRQAYRAGEVDLLRVLDAERARQRALLGEIRARAAQRLDAIQLGVALGGDTGDVLARRAAAARLSWEQTR